MSITNELRACIKKWGNFLGSDGGKAELLAIADRIDAEHMKSIMKTSSDIGNEVCYAYVALPLDADSKPIHVGDFVEEHNTRTVEKAMGEVIRIVYGKHATDIRIDTGTSYADRNPYNVRHIAKPPTVEDVPREFTDVIVEWERDRRTIADTGTWSDVAADFIAKLQLKETE